MPEKKKETSPDQELPNAPIVEVARRLGWFYGGLTHIDELGKEIILTVINSKDELFEAFIDGVTQRRIEDAEKQKANKSS